MNSVVCTPAVSVFLAVFMPFHSRTDEHYKPLSSLTSIISNSDESSIQYKR